MNVNEIICGDCLEDWHGCYDEGWKDLIVPEAFSHPAKMAYGLLSRILSHAKEQGWLGPQSIILDPFGGVGTTGILGAYEGYQVICVELEAKFVDLAEANFKLHDNAWQKLCLPRPIMIQGDSRRLVEVVQKADCIVSSPPFSEDHPRQTKLRGNWCKGGGDGFLKAQGYAKTKGNLGAMKAGDLIISSPPYAETPVEQTHMTSNKRGDESNPNYRPSWKKKLKEGYDKTVRPYGQTPGNLGNLKSGDLIISSPPYEGSEICKYNKKVKWNEVVRSDNIYGYGQTENNLSSKRGETFWSAAKIIVEQCHQILKPGGYAIWVCKDFVRNKKRVPFSKDWSRLCESAGFKLIHWHKASLVKETRHKTLFGHTETKKKERKSFFRRLAEAKGSPRIDEEDILCMRKQEYQLKNKNKDR